MFSRACWGFLVIKQMHSSELKGKCTDPSTKLGDDLPFSLNFVCRRIMILGSSSCLLIPAGIWCNNYVLTMCPEDEIM